MATRFIDHLLEGDHASRPAASAVPQGTLYSCTTHSLVYQSDTSSWSTWATLGGTPSGSITASGYTMSTDKLLGRDTASTGAIEELTIGSGLSLSGGTLSATGGSSVWSSATEIVAGSGGVASIDFTSIPGSGRHLYIEVMIRSEKSANFDNVQLRINNDSGSNYNDQEIFGFGATDGAQQDNASTFVSLGQSPGANLAAGLFGYYRIEIPYYASTVFSKVMNVLSNERVAAADTSGGQQTRIHTINWQSTAAITQVTLFFPANDVAEGSAASYYVIS